MTRPFLLAAGLLAVVFAIGGGSRADIASLAILRPLAAVVLVTTLFAIDREQWRDFRLEAGLALAILVLVLLQLVPLPPSLWQVLPGREILAEIDLFAGLENQWRPLSMDPVATRNAFWSLIVPIAMLGLLVRLGAAGQRSLLPVVLAIGAINGLISLLQVLGDPQGGLYFYAITNNGEAVGLFANRNHNAAFLATLFPLMAVWWAQARPGQAGGRSGRGWGSLAGHAGHRSLVVLPFALFVLILIVVTGSRAGTGLALLSIALTLALVILPASARAVSGAALAGAGRVRLAVLLAVATAAGLAATVWFGRDRAIERFFEQSAADDMRARILPTAYQMLETYLPWGTGAGTFDAVYRLHEPDHLLAPTYMNQAHNDWLDLALTSGIPGIMLALVLLACLAWRARKALAGGEPGYDRLLPRAALIGITVLALASLSDYPLRVPSLACLLVLLFVWSGPAAGQAAGLRES